MVRRGKSCSHFTDGDTGSEELRKLLKFPQQTVVPPQPREASRGAQTSPVGGDGYIWCVCSSSVIPDLKLVICKSQSQPAGHAAAVLCISRAGPGERGSKQRRRPHAKGIPSVGPWELARPGDPRKG